MPWEGSKLGARPALGSPEMLRMVSGHPSPCRGERADVLGEIACVSAAIAAVAS